MRCQTGKQVLGFISVFYLFIFLFFFISVFQLIVNSWVSALIPESCHSSLTPPTFLSCLYIYRHIYMSITYIHIYNFIFFQKELMQLNQLPMCYVAKVHLELLILLFQCWDNRHTLPNMLNRKKKSKVQLNINKNQ